MKSQSKEHLCYSELEPSPNEASIPEVTKKPQVSTATVLNTPLEQYQVGQSFYFANASEELIAKPPFANLLKSGSKTISEQCKDSLSFARSLGFETPVVVGAIPFDVRQPHSLAVSTNVIRTEKSFYTPSWHSIGDCKLTEQPSQSKYQESVKAALKLFETQELKKVVLSRTLDVQCQRAPSVQALIRNLATRNKLGYIFAVNSDGFNSDKSNSTARTLIGASPELLVSRRGNAITANPLAGSEPRQQDPKADHEISQTLLHSEKDLREHAYVIQAIREALEPLCKNLSIPDSPSLIHTPTLWHLSTRITGELRDSATTALDLALAMHPTPAICGYPTNKAFEAIQQLESFDRNLFSGMVGWCDAQGDGEWAVTIRCAEVQERHLKLFAGAGIVPGSCPEKECAETDVKFKTMLEAMGVAQS